MSSAFGKVKLAKSQTLHTYRLDVEVCLKCDVIDPLFAFKMVCKTKFNVNFKHNCIVDNIFYLERRSTIPQLLKKGSRTQKTNLRVLVVLLSFPTHLQKIVWVVNTESFLPILSEFFEILPPSTVSTQMEWCKVAKKVCQLSQKSTVWNLFCLLIVSVQCTMTWICLQAMCVMWDRTQHAHAPLRHVPPPCHTLD